jgi:hypothetical protein
MVLAGAKAAESPGHIDGMLALAFATPNFGCFMTKYELQHMRLWVI